MIVTIVRAGGLAGFVRRTELDSAELPPDAAARLRELAGALRRDAQSPAASPDELRYELTIVDDDTTWSLRATDDGLTEDERLLIVFVDGCDETVDSVSPL